ncbi:MAG TPA: hypothetical protein VM287_02750 [Egibacteraceae bacterium]|nr:hypothetical protein [Egibacteraceae bacterium]
MRHSRWGRRLGSGPDDTVGRHGASELSGAAPDFRHVWGQLLIGFIGGFASNLAAVLPAVLLGRAIDAVFSRGCGHGFRRER